MYGIGVDICEVQRFDRLKKDERFLHKIFTEQEIEYCEKRKASSECFAARFAAKEAFMKALGTGLSKGVHLKDIEVKNEPNGNPFLVIHSETNTTLLERGGKIVHLSISHEKKNAIAFVIIE